MSLYDLAKKSSPVNAKSPGLRGIADTKSPIVGSAQQKQKAKVYDDASIKTLLEGYMIVHPLLWDYIPVGSHIRYVKKGPGSMVEKFKPGGFVKGHGTSKEGKKLIFVENKINGSPNDKGYVSFPINYENVDVIYKRYAHSAFIEIQLMYQSLEQKRKQIEDLTARVAELEAIVKTGRK